MIAAISNSILRALLAPTCAACDRPLHAPLDGAICDTCATQLPCIPAPICPRCGDHYPAHGADESLCGRCRGAAPAFDCARSAGVYDGSLRGMVHALKYRRRRMIAPWLASRMRMEGAAVLRDADAVVPVPLHAWRQWQRGFNQADDLAMGLGLPVWRVLRRQRRGPPQASLPASARAANARGAYALCRRERFRTSRLRGATVVLVDDVMTTGATLEACARVLRSADVASVRVLTAARAVTVRSSPPLPRPRPSTVLRR